LLHPEAEWIPDPRTGIAPKHGREEVIAFFLDQAEMFGDVQVEVDDLRESGDRVCALIRVAGSGFASGARVDIRIGHVWDVREGRITRGEGFGDRERALESAGLTQS
jgi:ketosteroid isomerase-like protein